MISFHLRAFALAALYNQGLFPPEVSLHAHIIQIPAEMSASQRSLLTPHPKCLPPPTPVSLSNTLTCFIFPPFYRSPVPFSNAAIAAFTNHKLSGLTPPSYYAHGLCGLGIWTGHREDGLSLLLKVWRLNREDSKSGGGLTARV